MSEDKKTQGTPTPGNQPPKKEKEGTNKTVITVLIGVLFAINLLLGYLWWQDNQDYQKQESAMQSEISAQVKKLDELSVELEEKIATIERLGGDVEELKKVKAELEAEKEKFKSQANWATTNLNRLKNKVEGYEELLVQKDEEIADLKAINEALYTENTDLKTEKESLNDSIGELSEVREELQSKVEMASRLKAENITVAAVNNRGKEREGEFRNRHVDQLKVSFNLAKNDVAPIEGKDIFIRVIDNNGQVIFDVAKGSGTFMLNNKEEFYTSKKNILFDNTRQQLTFLYEKGSEYEEGEYLVEIWAEDYIIGEETFTVK
ncbi:chromosome segregation protein SMC [Mangrovivirga cuniculi]|uniref:Chromosome segregation protein SMC n=1 Tax=Mangrovivirga cuniculi TaxID=2715131 RepID=A0A4D7JKB5_9BACT|nr:chromosome segregation protein SMC [Mangrovivirga cuniculi]QCK16041.1 chromosome segregation protein SMC [Mangrovivirga cuniculi]